MIRRSVRVAALGALGLLALVGCGSSSGEPSAEPSVDLTVLPGARVGELAEKQLEAEHLEMATGAIVCPDLPWEVDASVRCEKTAELSGGRRVKIGGTVTVTSVAGYGKLHVELDDEVSEYGVDAGHLSAAVSSWVEARSPGAGAARCPYLPGRQDAVVHCTVRVAGDKVVVRVSVTDLDDEEFRTSYALRWVD